MALGAVIGVAGAVIGGLAVRVAQSRLLTRLYCPAWPRWRLLQGNGRTCCFNASPLAPPAAWRPAPEQAPIRSLFPQVSCNHTQTSQRIKSFCGAKPPRKLRWTDAGRCRLVVGYGDFTQDAGWRGR